MQQEWAEHILTMIPERLQQTAVLKEVIEELFNEIRTDYTGSMKKSMGKFPCLMQLWIMCSFEYHSIIHFA